MSELRDARRKRLYMRSIRRGIKEMDIILTRFADACLDDLSQEDLDRYEALLSENDQDLYQWVSGQVAAPEAHAPILQKIVSVAVPKL